MTTVLTGSQIDRVRVLVIAQAIETHIKWGGKMRLTRNATPANLRACASEYTGKTYPRSLQGLAQAGKDMRELLGDQPEV